VLQAHIASVQVHGLQAATNSEDKGYPLIIQVAVLASSKVLQRQWVRPVPAHFQESEPLWMDLLEAYRVVNLPAVRVLAIRVAPSLVNLLGAHPVEPRVVQKTSRPADFLRSLMCQTCLMRKSLTTMSCQIVLPVCNSAMRFHPLHCCLNSLRMLAWTVQG
jgi:hypothetical protein